MTLPPVPPRSCDATAWLFPGQGADVFGVGLAFDRGAATPRLAELLDHAAHAARTTRAALFERGGRALGDTRVAQPALVALCLGLSERLRDAGFASPCAAGHSLGAIAAWSSLGGIQAEHAVDVAAERGRLMAREAARHPGGMVALVDANEGVVEEALRSGGMAGALVVAARNAPDEWVLSGDEAAVTLVAARFRSVRLAGQGPWHSHAMAHAVDELAHAFEALPRGALAGDLVLDRTGAIASPHDDLPRLFAEQLVHPVDWPAVLRTLHARGIRRFVTIGPGKFLRATVRRSLGADAIVLPTDSPRDLDTTLKALDEVTA